MLGVTSRMTMTSDGLWGMSFEVMMACSSAWAVSGDCEVEAGAGAEDDARDWLLEELFGEGPVELKCLRDVGDGE